MHKLVLCLASVTLLCVAGCSKSAPPAGGPGATGGPGGGMGGAQMLSSTEPGAKLFNANGCVRCHAVKGQGGRRAPDLTKVGGKAGRDAAWFVAQIKDPKSHKPGARMPSYAGKISDADLKVLSEWLTGLK
ncbi:MAG: cytochrome c [Armatimonadetes bacterium]|nr:cytochrome c [Armatimonadota bacterium]